MTDTSFLAVLTSTYENAYALTDQWQSQLVERLTEGWEPTVQSPQPYLTWSWPLTSLFSNLLAISLYYTMVLFGFILIYCIRGKNKKIKDSRFIYSCKFFYNFWQIITNSYMFVECIILLYKSGNSILPFTKDRCPTFDTINPYFHKLLWYYYISKLIDCFDTFFIIVSNKAKQLSFLHYYHHGSVLWTVWGNLLIGFDGSVFLVILMNTFVHCIMYTYYLISMHLLTKENKNNIWWKKYLTAIQIIQFSFGMIQCVLMIYHDCRETSPLSTKILFCYLCSFLILFLNFFIINYISGGNKKRNPKKKRE